MAPNLTAKSGYQFLSRTMTRRFDGHVNLVQTDGGPEFKAEFKKNEQSYIELQSDNKERMSGLAKVWHK